MTLQENNAIAVIDVAEPCHAADGSRPQEPLGGRQGFDPSDRDGMIRIGPWPVRGYYMPDGISSYDVNGRTFLVTANEGDVRASPAYTEARRVSELRLDPTRSRGRRLQQDVEPGPASR